MTNILVLLHIQLAPETAFNALQLWIGFYSWPKHVPQVFSLRKKQGVFLTGLKKTGDIFGLSKITSTLLSNDTR